MEMDKIIVEFKKFYVRSWSFRQMEDWLRSTFTQVRRDAVEEGYEKAIEKLSDDSSQLATASIKQGIKMCIDVVNRSGGNFHSPKPKDYIKMFEQLLTDKPTDKEG